MTPDTRSLRTIREDMIDELCRRFAADELSLGELERRLEKARAARTRDELRVLVRDLPGRPSVERNPVVERRPRQRNQPVTGAKDIPEAATAARGSAPGSIPVRTSSHLAIAVMGGTRRAGRWVPPTNLAAVAIMGGVELDFREAILRGEDVEINCFAFWGGIEITVPPGVHVDTRGFALMGGFDQSAEVTNVPAPGAPTIRINGFALMGGVDVNVAERE